MKYGDLIEFEPLETILQLRDANDQQTAASMIKTYVMSDEMAERITEIIIQQLQFDNPSDNKGILVIGNYGTGKSHLMSVVSSIAEHIDLLSEINHPVVADAAKAIAGKFKVIRTEISAASEMSLRDIVTSVLTKELASMGVTYNFEPASSVINHKTCFEEMMAAFQAIYPDHGLLFVVDELLDYLDSRKDQEVVQDLGFMREMAESCKTLRFRYIAGIQEAIFDSHRFQFVSDRLRRVKDRFEQVFIARNDIKYVVSERLLKKKADQLANIRTYLTPFAKFYGNMNERMDEFVNLFPVHPDYIDTFEQVSAVEKRQILKSLSKSMKKLMELDVPTDHPGLIAYDSYWQELSRDKGYRTIPDIREVINVSDVLQERIKRSFTRPPYQDLAVRIIDALSLHRLTVNDIHSPVGATAQELRDALCLYQPGIDDMGGDPADDMLSLVETVLREIHKTVSGQFISANADNHQFYIDLKKTDDFDAIIEQRAETLSSEALNRAYHTALYKILECSDLPSTDYRNLWGDEVIWPDRNSGRMGWLFFGIPNERSTAYPPRDFYLYFIHPFNPEKINDEKRADELQFFLTNYDDSFKSALEKYAAAVDLAGTASGNSKSNYEKKADSFRQLMNTWLQEHMTKAFDVVYQGKRKPMMDWVKGKSIRERAGIGAHERLNFRDVINIIAGITLDDHFATLAPEYPKFSVLITERNREQYAKDCLRMISGSSPTKQATAVMDALKLLNDGRIAPSNSPYAQYILNKLKAKAQGQVVNQSELLEEIHGAEYLAPDSYRLENQWTVVLLASLVYSGDIVLAIPGKKFDASKLSELATTPIDDIAAFKHIEQPKDWNLPGLQVLYELLGLAPGLAIEVSQGKDGSIASLQDRIADKVGKLVTTIHSLKEQLPFWSGKVLSDAEAEQYRLELTKTKNFLESLQGFKTVGHLKNFRYGVDEVKSYQSGLDQLAAIEQLQEVVEELTNLASYLSKAEAVLPISHPDVKDWQERLKTVRSDLLKSLGDKTQRMKSGFQSNAINQLAELKNEYIRIYSGLFAKARLTLAEDKRKNQLMNDQRLDQLQKLSTIDILQESQLSEFRNELASLKTASPLSSQDLMADPLPSHAGFQPNHEDLRIPAAKKLELLEDRLDQLVNEWTQNLLDNLEDPVIHDSLNLLPDSERALIKEFIANKALPMPVADNFVKALRQVLQGLVPVKLSTDQIQKALFSQGAAATVEQIKHRLDQFLTEQCRGQDINKVRIVLK